MVLVLPDFPIILPFKQKEKQQQQKTKPKTQQQNLLTPQKTHHHQQTPPNTKMLVKMSLYVLFLTPVFSKNSCN